ncbi:M28 family metallopeptidase [Salinibacterium sp. ZJ70]|uniref:M28 family metallopeptidase n=1 Tax=Salinibacterium sp. ZJ70 TaxID=2708084 RepID=UPI0014218486|nr:M28 family metallopeptidase [Salinibacterium sp. ZJ70]
MKAPRKTLMSAGALATGVILSLGLASPAAAGGPGHGGGHGHGGPGNGHGPGGKGDTTSQTLRNAVSATSIQKHLEALQRIADENGGNRASGTAGHEASAAYIEKVLKRTGAYNVERQPFSYDLVTVERAEFVKLTPDPVDFVIEEDFYPMEYSGEGAVEGAVVTPVDVNLEGDRANTSGCEAEDFADFPAGSIALVQRGSCNFAVKATNAQAAGAAGVIIFNQGNDDPADDRFGVLIGTLGAADYTIPVVGASFAVGEGFALAAESTASIIFETSTSTVETFNVIATSKKGDPTKQAVIGAHLDGVHEGPGINDNGSGSAGILEVAVKLAETKSTPKNQLRFAWWSGEEDGLQGSNYYVSQLTEEQAANTALNLNFDMIGSPNAVRFVYDGDGDAFGDAGPEGSAEIEKLFTDYFTSQGLATEPTAFDGRSDYFAFIEAGIPAGGLFTGAEDIKSEEQAAIFGGTAGEAFDPCYHQACDDISNIDLVVLEQMADAAAHAVHTVGQVTTKQWHGHKGPKGPKGGHHWDGHGMKGPHGGHGHHGHAGHGGKHGGGKS